MADAFDWFNLQDQGQGQGSPAPVGTGTVLAPPPDQSQGQPDSSGRVLGVKPYIADLLKSVFDNARANGRIPSPSPPAPAPMPSGAAPGALGPALSGLKNAMTGGLLVGGSLPSATSDALTNFLMQSPDNGVQPSNGRPLITRGVPPTPDMQGPSPSTVPAVQSFPSGGPVTYQGGQQPQSLSARIDAAQPSGGTLSKIGGALGNFLHRFGQGAAHQVGMSDQDIAQRAEQIASEQSQTNLRNTQAQQLNTMVMTPWGLQPLAIAKAIDPQYVKGQFGVQTTGMKTDSAETIAANNVASKEKIAAEKLAAEGGKVGKYLPGVDPETGQPGYMKLDKQGNVLGWVPHSVVTGLIAKTANTVQWIEDGNGGFVPLPKSTTTTPSIPGMVPGRVAAPSTVPSAAQQTAPQAAPQAQPTIQQHPVIKALNEAGVNMIQNPLPNAKPGHVVPGQAYIGPDGKPVLGKNAVVQGFAYNPKTNETELISRIDANTNGYTNFRPATAKLIDDNRSLNNQLYDVAQKVNRYEDSIRTLPEYDQNKIAYLLNSDKFKLGAFGLEIPIDEANTYLRQARLGELSKEGWTALNAYRNARESLVGYNRVLSGSSRSNEKQLELNLQALPMPTDPKGFISNGIGQFRENLRIVGAGIPRMPGIPSVHDISTYGAGAGANGNGRPAPKSNINFVPDK